MSLALQPADYALCAATVAMAVLGLFRGFSGTLGFALASVAAAAVGTFAWPYSETLTTVAWQRAGGTLVAVLLAFGLVRLVVKKLVNGLLAQPTDALLGGLVGALMGAGVVLAWGWTGSFLEYSALASQAAQYLNKAVERAATEGGN